MLSRTKAYLGMPRTIDWNNKSEKPYSVDWI